MIDIIWNLTAICPWDCAACCVAAVQTTQRKGTMVLSAPDLSMSSEVPRDFQSGSVFDQALAHRQAMGLELTLAAKLRVLENLRGLPVRLDFSGGDVLAPTENLEVLRAAASMLGKEMITLTATGAGLAQRDVAEVAGYISELNFTYDGERDPHEPMRPAAYAAGNLRKAKEFMRAGVRVRAECPLTRQNIDPEVLTRIYSELAEAGVHTLLPMRLFPVGRGSTVAEAVPKPLEYAHALRLLRRLEAKLEGPRIKLQCALRSLESSAGGANPCDAFTESFGLMWDGTLLGSPWAINSQGRPIDEAWVLGNLSERSLTEILASERVVDMRSRSDENHGHCKMFAWLNGVAEASQDRMLELTDPLINFGDSAEDVA